VPVPDTGTDFSHFPIIEFQDLSSRTVMNSTIRETWGGLRSFKGFNEFSFI